MMVELTELEALGYIGTIFTTGVSAGYAFAYALLSKNKIITTTKNICQITIDNKQRNLAIEKIFVNGKQSDISCNFLVKGKCELIETRCKYI